MLGRSNIRGINTRELRKILRAKSGTVLLTPHPSRLTTSTGFTLVELIGVLAILAILASFITPNVINQLRSARRDAEDRQLANIAQGVELYIRQTRSLPANLAALSPDYVAISLGQLTNNANGFLRYFFIQPNISGYTNPAGLTSATLADSRFLLITDLNQNANPTITTDAEFETWWTTDETGTPDLKIARGHVGHLFHLLSLSADGAGGSYRVDNGTSVNAGAGTLASRVTYHITGTSVELDEAPTFGTADTQFTLTTDAGYRFDPDCTSGSQWRVISSGCYAP
ncbi:MAG: prepilin-type N-terminal cleavage/methylation domain-containing protein [Nitrospirales bacterium]